MIVRIFISDFIQASVSIPVLVFVIDLMAHLDGGFFSSYDLHLLIGEPVIAYSGVLEHKLLAANP